MNFIRSLLSVGSIGNENFFTQKIDHFDPSDNRTYQQRYFVNSTFSKNNSKNLIVFIGGESELTPASIIKSSVRKLAETTQSTIVGLEHRFFGKSQPFDRLSKENLRYLTVEQALEDLASFVKDQRTKYCGDGKICDVLVVGGSYPGSLSSWFRLKYPHLANYSWSSSAPLNVKLEFPDYEASAIRSFKEINEKCYENTKMIIDAFSEGIMADNKTVYDYLENSYSIPNTTNKVSIVSILTGFVFYGIQYNSATHLIDNYCLKNSGDTQDYNAFNEFFWNVSKQFSITPTSQDYLEMTDEDPYSDNSYMRCWTWMQCNQLGWFSTPAGFTPSVLNLSYYDEVCKTLFDVDLPNMEMNKIYGGNNPDTSFVIYTNGGIDPWSSVSVNQTRVSLAQFSYTFKDASHCFDLSSENLSLAVREKLGKWMQGNTCVHGQNVLDSCVCDPNYGGDRCDIATVSEKLFWLVGVLTMVSPLILIIIIGGSAWWIFRKIQEEQYIMKLK